MHSRLVASLVAFLIAGLPQASQTQSATDGRSPERGRASAGSVLTGTIRDESGAPIGGATVLVPSLERSATTNSNGEFTLRELPTTTMAVQVRAVGYRSIVRQFALRAGETQRLDVTLGTSTVQLMPMVVTGTARSSDLATPLDVAAIEPEKLKAFASASLGRTLERVPGVSNISTGAMAGNPVLRGMSQGQIRLTRDGLPIESYQGTSRWTPPISFASVDRVEIIRGPASVLYGSSALGGAVNFLPKALPRADGGGGILSALVETQYFSNNAERFVNAEAASALSSGIGLRVGSSRRTANEFRTPSALSYTVTHRKHDPLYVGRISYSNYEQAASYAQVGAAGRWGQVQALYDGFDGFNNFLNQNGRATGVRNQNHEFRLRGSLLQGGWLIKPALVFQNLRIQRAASIAKTFEVARDSALWDQDLGKHVYTARLETEHAPLGSVAGKLGVEYQYQDGTTRLSAIEPSSDVYDAAAFAFEEWRRNRLTISAGGRFDYRRQRAALGSLVAALPQERQDDALDQAFSVFTGSIGTGLRLTNYLTWTASINSGFHAPAIQDLYTNENRPAFGWLEGNPALKPERSLSVESALRVQSSRVAGSVTAYRNKVKDYIYFLNTGRTRQVGTATRNVFTNGQTDAVLRGIELGAEAEAMRFFYVDASYAAIRTENLTTSEALPLMPADNFRASIRYAPARVGALRAPYVRFGVKRVWAKSIAGATEPFADGDTNPAGFGTGSTPAYTIYEAGLGGRIIAASNPIDISLDAQNLTDVVYRDFLDTQKGYTLSMGRNVSLRVSMPFTIGR